MEDDLLAGHRLAERGWVSCIATNEAEAVAVAGQEPGEVASVPGRDRLSKMVTGRPLAAMASARLHPMNPAPPVISVRSGEPSGPLSVCLMPLLAFAGESPFIVARA